MKLLKIISCVLAFVMILALAVSCGGNDSGSTASTPGSGGNTSRPDSGSAVETQSDAEPGESAEPVEESREVSTEPAGPLDHIEDYALSGEKIVFLVENGNLGYPSIEIIPNEELGPEIAGAVRIRNDMLIEKLGCELDEIRTDNMAADLRNAALTEPEFDIATPYMTTAAPLIIEDLFWDLYEFSDIINFDAPYWDQNADTDLSMGGKLYMTTGDFSLLTMDVTHCMIFNKNVLSAHAELESPYDLVESGDWTIDKMLEMARVVTADTDGEDGITYKDTIGLFINYNYSNSLYIASGEKFVEKDANGVPRLAFDGDRQVEVASKIFDLFHDPAVIYDEGFNPQAIADGFKNCYWAARHQLATDNALFVTISLSDVLNLADYDANFGFLITPKYTKEQDRYYSYISVIKATACVIPVGNTHPEKAALLLEAMNAASTETVKRTYYEIVFKLQKARDQEDSDMLDKIFASRVYDIGSIYNWGGARDFISNVCTGASFDYTSQLDSKRGSMETAMQDTVDYFNGN